jgi:transcriptional regulator with XRE-family HTH domain
MVIGERLRTLRDEKKISQGEIEHRTGLLRCYISRVENGYTVPAVATLEKFARALEVPMYQIFCDSENPPKLPIPSKRNLDAEITFGSNIKEKQLIAKFCQLLSHMEMDELKLILFVAQKMAQRNGVRSPT